MSAAFSLRYDPRLVEEALFQLQRGGRVLEEWEAERTRIYQIPDPSERDRRFTDLSYSWFQRLALGQVVEQALSEQPIILSSVPSGFVVRATRSEEESAELFVAADRSREDEPRRTVRILIRPETLVRPEPALAFLRHELFHIADMLDPAFAYEPALPKTEGGPTYDTLIANRYRVIWDTTINGRMARRGWLPDGIRERQLAEFRQAFPMLEHKTEDCFRRFFDAEPPKHAEIAAFALDPRSFGKNQRPTAGTHCPLCQFPTHSFEPEPENLGDDLLAAIERDFPRWTPDQGLCAQCADLYRASRLSMAAAMALPGASSYFTTRSDTGALRRDAEGQNDA
ncbi:MAG TPA: hypothetical protein VNO43_03645 [Candidatus Eisenbacteria bacterium]|nr:hypothetical protein [Candidatus Eisenbacteria bacterium]